MPYTVIPEQWTVDYFLDRYEGFKKQVAEFKEKNPLHSWSVEHSSFSDPGDDYNRLILIGFNEENGEEVDRISLTEKGY